MTQSVFLPVVCSQCQAQLVIHLTEDEEMERGVPAHDVTWTCPNCQRSTTVSLYGTVVSVELEPPPDEQ